MPRNRIEFYCIIGGFDRIKTARVVVIRWSRLVNVYRSRIKRGILCAAAVAQRISLRFIYNCPSAAKSVHRRSDRIYFVSHSRVLLLRCGYTFAQLIFVHGGFVIH